MENEMDANSLQFWSIFVGNVKEIAMMVIPMIGGYFISRWTRGEDIEIELKKNRQIIRQEIVKEEIRNKLSLYKDLKIDFQKFLDKVRDVVPPCNEMSWEELKSDYADKVECNKKEIVRIKDVYLGRLDKPMMNKIYELLDLINDKTFYESGYEPTNVDEWMAWRDHVGKKYADELAKVIKFIEDKIEETLKNYSE